MFGKENIGLYRGGFGKENIGLHKNKSARLAEKTKKKTSKVFRTIWIKIHGRGKLTHGINIVDVTTVLIQTQ